MNVRVLIRSIAVFAVVIGAFVLIKATPVGEMLDTKWIDEQIRGQGLRGEIIFFCIGAAFTAVGLPRQVVAFLGGYAFGTVLGTALSLVAVIGGCILTFTFSRFFARDLVAHKFPDRLKRFDAFLSENTFTTAVLIRFLPVGSNLLTNLLAGVSRARALPFLAGSAFGYVPQMLIFALAGSGLAVEPDQRLIVSIALFALSGALGLFLYRRYRDSHHLLNAGVVDAEDVGPSEVSRKS